MAWKLFLMKLQALHFLHCPCPSSVFSQQVIHFLPPSPFFFFQFFPQPPGSSSSSSCFSSLSGSSRYIELPENCHGHKASSSPSSSLTSSLLCCTHISSLHSPCHEPCLWESSLQLSSLIFFFIPSFTHCHAFQQHAIIIIGRTIVLCSSSRDRSYSASSLPCPFSHEHVACLPCLFLPPLMIDTEIER